MDIIDKKYKVFKNGTVKNLEKNEFVPQRIDKNGYCVLNIITTNKEKKTMKAHRLIALTFIPNPENKPQVNHIDGNKQNNDVSNLEWVSRQENITHAWSTGLSTNEMNQGKGMILYIGTCLSTGTVVHVEGKDKLSELGYSLSCVVRVCKGERASHKNMTWEKVKSPERLTKN